MRVTLNSHKTNKPVALGFQIKLGFRNVGFLRREEKPQGKNPQGKDENQQQTKRTCDTESENRTLNNIGGRQVLLPLQQPCSP